MGGRILVPDLRAFDADGHPISGAKLHTYVSGTTTDLATFQEEGLANAHENPIETLSDGRFPDIYAPFDTAYRIVVTDADDDVINDSDPVYAQGAANNPAPGVIAPGGTITAGDVNKRLEITGAFTMPLGANLPEGWRVKLKCTVTSAAITYSGADTGDVSTLYNTDFYEVTWDGSTFKFDYIGGGQGKYMLPITATAMRPNTTSGGELAIAEMATNKQMVASFNFDAATQEHIQFSFPMPKAWDGGPITARFVWHHPSTTTNFGVAWGIQAVAISDGDALDAAWGTAVVVTDTGGATNTNYATAESADMTIAGTPAEGDSVYFRIFREVANAADTMAVDAKLTALHLFLNTNAPNDR